MTEKPARNAGTPRANAARPLEPPDFQPRPVKTGAGFLFAVRVAALLPIP